MSDDFVGTPTNGTPPKVRDEVMEVVKKYLSAQEVLDPDTGKMGLREEVALDVVGELAMVWTYILAGISYAKGEDKADMTIKFMTMVPILDKMLNKAYDKIGEMDVDELFPGMRPRGEQ